MKVALVGPALEEVGLQGIQAEFRQRLALPPQREQILLLPKTLAGNAQLAALNPHVHFRALAPAHLPLQTLGGDQ